MPALAAAAPWPARVDCCVANVPSPAIPPPIKPAAKNQAAANASANNHANNVTTAPCGAEHELCKGKANARREARIYGITYAMR